MRGVNVAVPETVPARPSMRKLVMLRLRVQGPVRDLKIIPEDGFFWEGFSEQEDVSGDDVSEDDVCSGVVMKAGRSIDCSRSESRKSLMDWRVVREGDAEGWLVIIQLRRCFMNGLLIEEFCSFDVYVPAKY